MNIHSGPKKKWATLDIQGTMNEIVVLTLDIWGAQKKQRCNLL